MKIENIETAFLQRSIIASGLPCKHTDEKDTDYNARLKRAVVLAKNSSNSGHPNFLKGIRVAFELTCSHAMLPQLLRYNFIDIVSSQSKMYCITKFDIDKQCNEFVSGDAVNELMNWVKEYNERVARPYLAYELVMDPCEHTKYDDGEFKELLIARRELAINEALKRVIYNTPMGFELKMEVSTNYMQLRNIYHQRKGHKLNTEWGPFNEAVECLPLADVFITNTH